MRVDQISLLAAFGAVAGPAFFAGGFRDLRLKRLIQNTPTSRIRSAAMGLVEVNGVIECRSTVAARKRSVPAGSAFDPQSRPVTE